ncbi:MAG: acetate kinase [Marinobacter sp.]|uniref:acetate/propionate family kinase n=1 Tax=Marinobacter sp. TaxID=50741 RepID=UPI00299D2092|nr:acetate kinase [Marinobacter sp.]MDX1635058.1 acetate kinase [Marinobacter sp.]
MDDVILVVNCGSSSLKLGLFNRDLESLATGLAERLGQDDARAEIDSNGKTLDLPAKADHQQALEVLVQGLRDQDLLGEQPLAIGHRVVHGGEAFTAPALLDDDVIATIDRCASLAPLHNPVNLTGIRATRKLFPEVPQVAVFDTAFHQTLPAHAYLYGLPRRFYEDWGVRRYGFHGTSHYYMLRRSAELLEREPGQTSIISAHLGNGCSITAIRDGRSVDTSMGLTPLEGLVMGTRSGDIDPGLVAFLDRKGIDAGELDRILNRESGLLGLSGSTNDMRKLVALADDGDRAAGQALAVFCFRLARYIGAMMASLDRLDALVFTGGIGENSARVRQDTLAHLGLLGFRLEPDANHHHGHKSGHRISHDDSRFPILVIATNEEAVIARAALEQGSDHG